MTGRHRHRTIVPLLCSLVAVVALSATAVAQTVHKLMPSLTTVHIGNFDSALKPVLTVDSGDIVLLESAGAIDPALIDQSGVVPPSAVPEYLRTIYREFKDGGPGPGGHVLTGPIAVRGAAPGDVLEIRILEVDLAVAYGYNLQRPKEGVLPDEFKTARQRIIPINLARKTATVAPGVVVPVAQPFFGVAGVAPPAAEGRVSSAPPGHHGGNLDNKDLVAGTILYVPVYVPGALFSAGDGHAAQGHGEVNLTAIETGLRGKFQLIVRKDMKLTWPRAET
ncbi:MAG: acetamidase/formamidase family protein, partial [Casimicrobiaceae bacterium]